jgi:CRP-like cAMP-binding protein
MNEKESNLILRGISFAEHDALVSRGVTVDIPRYKVLYEVGDRISEVYFIRTGFASLIAAVDDESLVEVAMVGKEAVLGAVLALGLERTPYRWVIPARASLLSVKAERFLEVFRSAGKFQSLLLRYLGHLVTQVTQAAGCNTMHPIKPRLSKWLLISRYHLGSEELPLTQSFLSEMLGTSRTAVTLICAELARSRVIRQQRSRITILDPAKLEGLACPCYEKFRKEILRLSATQLEKSAPIN